MIKYSTSFLEFLENSDCQIAEILVSAHYKTSMACELMVTNKEVDYITFRNNGQISFLPAGKKPQFNDDHSWKREGRQEGRAARVIKKLFTLEAQKLFKDTDFECFSNSYKATFNDNGYSFSLLCNKAIPSVYDMALAEGEGSLNNSCMNGDSRLLSIYKNCEKLKILRLTNKDENLCGRALIWNISESITLMDRIYVTQDFMYEMFLEYAKKNKYWYKKDYTSYDNKTAFITDEGVEVSECFTIHTDTDFNKFPYIDTFTYGDDGSLNNFGDGPYSYDNTGGTRSPDEDEDNEDEQGVYDEIGGCYIDEDEASYITVGSRRHQWTRTENTVVVRGNTYWIEDDDICTVDGEFHLSEDCCYSDMHDSHYLQDDCVWSDHHSDHLLRYEAVEISDDWYLLKSVDIVKIGYDFYLKSDEAIECVNGIYTLIENTQA